jgi:hypothetical protein
LVVVVVLLLLLAMMMTRCDYGIILGLFYQ